MTPELADKLRKAHEALAGARTILAAGLPGVAAREAERVIASAGHVLTRIESDGSTAEAFQNNH